MAAAKTVAIEPHHFKAISRNSHLLSVHRSLISKFRSFLFSLFFFNIRSYFILWSLRNKLVINPHVLSSLLTLPPKKKIRGEGKWSKQDPLFLDARRFFFRPLCRGHGRQNFQFSRMQCLSPNSGRKCPGLICVVFLGVSLLSQLLSPPKSTIGYRRIATET